MDVSTSTDIIYISPPRRRRLLLNAPPPTRLSRLSPKAETVCDAKDDDDDDDDDDDESFSLFRFPITSLFTSRE